MRITEIKELLQLVEKLSLTKVNITIKDTSISVEKSTQTVLLPPPNPSPASTTVSSSSYQGLNASSKDETLQSTTSFVKSPMIGTFYHAKSSDDPPFVSVGTEIKKGDIVGIIEAMKLFNEIESDQEGVVIEILAKNASPIEFGQPLIKIQSN